MQVTTRTGHTYTVVQAHATVVHHHGGAGGGVIMHANNELIEMFTKNDTVSISPMYSLEALQALASQVVVNQVIMDTVHGAYHNGSVSLIQGELFRLPLKRPSFTSMPVIYRLEKGKVGAVFVAFEHAAESIFGNELAVYDYWKRLSISNNEYDRWPATSRLALHVGESPAVKALLSFSEMTAMKTEVHDRFVDFYERVRDGQATEPTFSITPPCRQHASNADVNKPSFNRAGPTGLGGYLYRPWDVPGVMKR